MRTIPTINTTTQKFHEFSKQDRDKIAANIERRTKETFLSPVVEDYVYATTRSLDAGDIDGVYDKECNYEHAINKNADYFDITELEDIHPEKNIPRYLTFRSANLFTNHNSKDIENSIGLCFDSVLLKEEPYNDMHVVTLIGLDSRRSPSVARTLQTYPKRVPVSMGCTIKYSEALCCGKVIRNEADFCDHLKYHRGSRYNGRRVAEKLRGVDFYELSVVATPACPTAYIIDALHGTNLLPDRVLRVASTSNSTRINELLNTSLNIHELIKNARTASEKIRLATKLDELIFKLEILLGY